MNICCHCVALGDKLYVPCRTPQLVNGSLKRDYLSLECMDSCFLPRDRLLLPFDRLLLPFDRIGLLFDRLCLLPYNGVLLPHDPNQFFVRWRAFHDEQCSKEKENACSALSCKGTVRSYSVLSVLSVLFGPIRPIRSYSVPDRTYKISLLPSVRTQNFLHSKMSSSTHKPAHAQLASSKRITTKSDLDPTMFKATMCRLRHVTKESERLLAAFKSLEAYIERNRQLRHRTDDLDLPKDGDEAMFVLEYLKNNSSFKEVRDMLSM